MAQLLEFFHHHLFLFAALGAALLLLIANEVHGAFTGGKRLGPFEAVQLINRREAVVVDVRPAGDFKKGHLLNALNLPLAQLEQRADEVVRDKSRPVIVYCALGSAATEAASRLRKHGYTEVYPLRGGINNWLNANLPVTAK
jgi:rhodanese-related sulfurtransferase